MISPYKGTFRVSQEYKGNDHRGIDLVGISDKRLFSTVVGTVVRAGWENPLVRSQGFGRRVVVRIGNSDVFMYFGHLSEINVVKGQRVKIGQQIGVEGTTGHSTGSHLHWEIRYGDVKSGFRDISSYSNIPNMQSREEKISSWGTELFGLSTLKEGQSNFPYNLYNVNAQYVAGATADGVFGAGTKAKVMAYQRAKNIAVDGKIGAITKAFMVSDAVI